MPYSQEHVHWRHTEVWYTSKIETPTAGNYCRDNIIGHGIDSVSWDYWNNEKPDTRGQIHSVRQDTLINGMYHETAFDSLKEAYETKIETIN